jgi:hypothetical protein
VEPLLLWIGRLAGIGGALATLVAFGARAAGVWHLGSLQIGSLLQAGIALTSLGALAYVAVIAERSAR